MNRIYITLLFPVSTVAFLYGAHEAKVAIAKWQLSIAFIVLGLCANLVAALVCRVSISQQDVDQLGGSHSREVHRRIPNWVNAFTSIALAAFVSAIAVWFV